MAMGPATTAPASPPRGYTETVKDQSSRIMLSSGGTPVRSCQVLFMNTWMYCEGRTVLCNHHMERKDAEKCKGFLIHVPAYSVLMPLNLWLETASSFPDVFLTGG